MKMGISAFRRKETPWEVVDSRMVDPVWCCDDDDLDLLTVASADVTRTYIFDLKHVRRAEQFSQSLSFAKQQLLKELATGGFNTLLSESWALTVLRRNSHYRVQIRYSGRPAHAVGKLPSNGPPPFMGVLKELN